MMGEVVVVAAADAVGVAVVVGVVELERGVHYSWPEIKTFFNTPTIGKKIVKISFNYELPKITNTVIYWDELGSYLTIVAVLNFT